MCGTDLLVQSCRGHRRFRAPGACQTMQYFRHFQTLPQDRVFWMQLNVDFYNFVSIVDVLVSQSLRPREDCLRTCGRKVKVKVVRICPHAVKTMLHHRSIKPFRGSRCASSRLNLPLQVLVGAVALYTLFATTTRSADLTTHRFVQCRRPSHRGRIRSLLSPLTAFLPSEHLTHAAALAVVARFLCEDLHSHHYVDGDFPPSGHALSHTSLAGSTSRLPAW